MNEVTLEESSQVLSYYAKRSSDLELQVLMSQAKTNTLNNEIQSLKSDNLRLKTDYESLKNQIETMKAESEAAHQATTKKTIPTKTKKITKTK